MKTIKWSLLILSALLALWSCEDDDDDPMLVIPNEYISGAYDQNVAAENAVIDELLSLTAELNAAEANSQSNQNGPITYPTTLASVTLSNYRGLIQEWLGELVKAANSTTAFQNPGLGDMPSANEEGGVLGTRLLDENGLELEQMIEKGSFGAALYNHAISVINGDLSSSAAIDKLIEIHGTTASFDPSETVAAATYSRRRSNLETETGLFFDIQRNLITAKAAIEGGSTFNEERDEALSEFLLNWEKSNFATVIFYCNNAKIQIQDANAIDDEIERNVALGNAMHAYAEGVAFAHGFKGVSRKEISDSQIEVILELLLAPEGQTPESYRFLNEATLLSNFDQIIANIQQIYGFTDAEVSSFFVNNNP